MLKASAVLLLCAHGVGGFQASWQTPPLVGIRKALHTGSHDHRSLQRATAPKSRVTTPRKNVFQLNAEISPSQLVQRLKKELSGQRNNPGLDANFVQQLDRSVAVYSGEIILQHSSTKERVRIYLPCL
jgi:hypothetical protein